MHSSVKKTSLAALGLAAFACVLLLPGCRWPWETNPAQQPLVLSGTIDARQVDVAFQVGGRIAKLLTDEGRPVQAGQPLAELDATDLQLAAERARAQADSSAKVLASLKAGARPQELRVAQAAVTAAQADKRFADQEVARTQKLIDDKFVAAEQLDRVRTAADAAAARLDQATQSLSLLQAGARKQDIERATADVAAASAAQRMVEQQLSYVRLTSPAAGVVSVRLAEAGQVVAAGQAVFRVAELAKPWVRAYLAETDVPRVKLSQRVDVRVDGAPGRVFAGRLAFISPQAEFTPKTVETRALRVDLVYRITVDVEDPDGLLKIGMPADVTVPVAPPS